MADNDYRQMELAWFRQQQKPAGWFELTAALFEKIVDRDGEDEGIPLLRAAGEALADAFPLPPSDTVDALQSHINALFSRFGWGEIAIVVGQASLRIDHYAAPSVADRERHLRWRHAFSAVLEGLFSRLIQVQSGKPHFSLRRESPLISDCIHFYCYHSADT